MTEQTERPLAQLLIQVGAEKVQHKGNSMSRWEVLARMTWDFVLEGYIRFPHHEDLWVTAHDWVSTLKWLHELFDGKPQPTSKAPAKSPTASPIPHVPFPLAGSRR